MPSFAHARLLSFTDASELGSAGFHTRPMVLMLGAAHGRGHLPECADVTFGIEEIESCSGILPKASGVEPLQHAIAADIHGIDRGDLNDRNPPRPRSFGGNACGIVALTTV